MANGTERAGRKATGLRPKWVRTAGLPKGSQNLDFPMATLGSLFFRERGEGGSAMMIAQLLARLNRQEDGQGMVEYALIIALVAIALVAALTALSGGVGTVFNSITHSL